jgi:hypothetical protein
MNVYNLLKNIIDSFSFNKCSSLIVIIDHHITFRTETISITVSDVLTGDIEIYTFTKS